MKQLGVGVVGCGVIAHNYVRGSAAFDSFDIEGFWNFDLLVGKHLVLNFVIRTLCFAALT